jgi:hypothetical protein
MWCIPKLTPEFKERMEDILTLYAKSYNPKEPVICLDEKSKQLLADSRPSLPTVPGKSAIQDYEYVRKGTANIFVAVEPLPGKRMTEVTEHRKKPDYALFVEKIIVAYTKAKTIHLVQDNLNIHFIASLIEAFGLRKAMRLWKRLTPHYTPKHASWLNMAEIEINAIGAQCLDRRINSIEKLRTEVQACTTRRNAKCAKITWKFTPKKAREKFPTLYLNEFSG